MNYVKVLGSVSPYCRNECNCPGYLITRNVNKILLDCGPGITSRMNMPYDLKKLTIIISHYHKDHYSDLFSIGYASLCYHRMGLLNNKIEVYVPEVKPGELGYDDYKLIKDFKESYFEVKTYTKYDKINIDDSVVSFYEVSHSIPSYSCKIENNDYKIVYTGDMGYKNIDDYVSFCKGADLLISEATYLEADNKNDENHLHAKEAAKIANMANVRMLLLTHFWPEHDKLEYLEEAESVFKNTVVADENVKIDLDNFNN